MNSAKKIPSPLVSLFPIAFLIGMLFATIHTFGSDALSGGSQISLLATTGMCVFIGMAFYRIPWKDYELAITNNISGVATAIIILLIIGALSGTWMIMCVFIGMAFYRIPWKDYELAITNNISGVATAIIILLIIGALSGTWMISGVVPTLIYYGMQIIHPNFFLASTCIICALVSVMTGSSWTTIATIGIALLGIGKAQGFEEGWIAGAIISGAYFGDKISPLSDTTVLASSVTETPLFSHIRYMMITTVPSLLITLVIFTVMGLTHETNNTQQIAEFTAALDAKFNITPWLLAVPVITGILIARRVPSVITLFLSTLLAGIFAFIFQPGLLNEIAEGGNMFKGIMMTFYGSTSLQTDSDMLTELIATRGMAGMMNTIWLIICAMCFMFKGIMMTFYGSTSLQTDSDMLTELIATRGMAGMMNTIWLIICAMCFGGAMTASGMLGSITSLFVRFMKNTASIVASTVCSGLFLNLATADQYISIILTGNMFSNVYAKKGYESRLLSRTTEDAVTVTSPLIPWNTCGMTQATILSVPTLTYLPYCFFNLISPVMSIFIAAIGYKIIKKPVNNPG